MKLRNKHHAIFKKISKIAIMLPVAFTSVNAFANPTVTPQEIRDGYRLTHCLAADITNLICDRKDQNVFEHVRDRFGENTEVVEVGVEYTSIHSMYMIIKIKLNR